MGVTYDPQELGPPDHFWSLSLPLSFVLSAFPSLSRLGAPFPDGFGVSKGRSLSPHVRFGW